MNERDFAYWLNGFAELTGEAPTAEQWKSIREHLATVFVKVTPPVNTQHFAFPSVRLPATPSIEDYFKLNKDISNPTVSIC